MSEEKNRVVEYYNKFSKQQAKTGVNLRHRTILRALKKAGLKRHHTVLEVGCGIGTVTGLLSAFLTKGSVLAIDISPESIKLASSVHSKRKNTRFCVSGTHDLISDELFDFIVMPDVLEHIPIELHQKVFIRLRSLAKKNSFLFIHIPSPRYQEYLETNQPELLQIIDQPVDAAFIIKNAENAGFDLLYFKRYSLAIEQGDYHQYIFKPLEPLTEVKKIPWIKMAWKEINSRFFVL